MYEMYADSWLDTIVTPHIRCSDAMLGIFILYLTLIVSVTGSVYWLLMSEGATTLHTMNPDDCVEIPQKYLHFQKRVSALHLSELPTWCKDAGLSRTEVFEEMIAWMKSELHPNYQDVLVVGDILRDGTVATEDTEPFIRILYEDACRWISVALAIWTHSPHMYMPCWSGHVLVQGGDEEDTGANTSGLCVATENSK